jgi:hypothetical protein
MSSKRLAAARGAVREGVAAAEGFAQLLGSRRVGPKGVARALPEVREACATLAIALQALDAAIAEEVAGDVEAAEAASAVLAHAAAEVARLSADLVRPGPRSTPMELVRAVDARQRLALDASARRAARELHDALHLTEILSAALDRRPTPIGLADVLRERSAGPAQGEPTLKVCAVSEPGCAVGFDADARVVGGLIELAAGIVRRAGVTSPALSAARRADGRVEVRIGAQGAAHQGDRAVAFELPLRGGGPRAVAVARAVARRAGMELAIEGEDKEVLLIV